MKYGTEEWSKLWNNDQERIKITEIPDEILNSLTTSALLKSVIDDPVLKDRLDRGRRVGNIIDDKEAIISSIFKFRKSFRELIKREDTSVELVNILKSIKEENFIIVRNWADERSRRFDEFKNSKPANLKKPLSECIESISKEVNAKYPERKTYEDLEIIELILLNDSIFMKFDKSGRLVLFDQIRKNYELRKKYELLARTFSLKLLTKIMIFENYPPIQKLLDEYKKQYPGKSYDSFFFEITMYHDLEDKINKIVNEFHCERIK